MSEVRTVDDGASIAVDEIDRFVRGFYSRVRDDQVLGPIFGARIEEWEPHLLRMVAFWTAVLHGAGTYQPGPRGTPPMLHRAIPELEREHFRIWLGLFSDTLHAQLDAERAELVMRRARRIAASLSAHLPGPPAGY